MNNREKVPQLNDMIPAFKVVCRKFKEDLFSSITQLNNIKVYNVVFGDNENSVEMHFDYVHKDPAHKTFTQVGVRDLKYGKVIKETFDYG